MISRFPLFLFSTVWPRHWFPPPLLPAHSRVWLNGFSAFDTDRNTEDLVLIDVHVSVLVVACIRCLLWSCVRRASIVQLFDCLIVGCTPYVVRHTPHATRHTLHPTRRTSLRPLFFPPHFHFSSSSVGQLAVARGLRSDFAGLLLTNLHCLCTIPPLSLVSGLSARLLSINASHCFTTNRIRKCKQLDRISNGAV